MRRVIILTALLFIVSTGFSNSQTKNKQKGQVQFSELIKKIEKKFDVSITYETEIAFKMTKKQAAKVIKMKTVEKALYETIKSKNISFKKIRNDYFVLSKIENEIIKDSENIRIKEEKERTISGIVTDKYGVAIPGVTILLKNTSFATMTDFDGKFSLTIPDNNKGVLVFSYIGFETQNIAISEASNYNVTLKEDEFGLEEVIISGVAGNTLKKKLTVTVEKVGGSELQKAPASSSASMLQGKLAGVNIKSAYGSPGSGATIKMRGATSLTGNSNPLIIVDGIMVNTNLADINVDDIENVEVVKGAAAAALYGSKAANGVIVVSTKRGNNIKNKFQIKVRNEYGISNIQKTLELATHHPYQLAADNDDFSYTKYEGVDYDDDGEVISNAPIPTDSSYADQPYAVVRDLQNEFFKKGRFYTNFISMANKSEKSNIYLSFENNKNTGIIFSTDGYTRQNLRFNADTKLNDYITISSSNLFMNAFTDKAAGSTFGAILFLSPDLDLHSDNLDGTPYRVNPANKFSNYQNPLYPLYHLEMNSKRNAFMSNVSTKITLTDWLNFDAKYTLERINTKSHTYNKKGYLYGDFETGKISKSSYMSNTGNYQITANFNKNINDFTLKSKISYLSENEEWEGLSATGEGFIITNVPQIDYTPDTLITGASNEGSIRAQNVFGILDLDYKSKYLVSGLVRRDGSSLFGENERWHTYYRFAGAYRITEDLTIPGIQELKIRAAIGTSGLRPHFSDQYEIITLDNGNPYRYQKGNKNLKPSKSKEIEYALDMQFLNVFNFVASYSETTTSDAILRIPLASQAGGYASQIGNAGTLFSNALELSLNVKAVNKKDFDLSLGLNYDRVRQKVIQLDINKFFTGPSPEFPFLIEDGQNFGVIIGKKWLTSLDEMKNQLPDGMTIEDYSINSDGYVITAGTEGSTLETPVALDEDNDGNPDKVIIADCNTDFNLNFNTTLSYKGITMYMLWGIKQGGDVYNKTKQRLFFENRAKEIDQYGKAENQKKSTEYYQKLYDANQINSHFVEDGSFIKLREFSFAYTHSFDKKMKISNILKSVKVGVVARNLLTISKYTGYDPEVGTSNAANFSYDNFGYPNFRTITGSIEFTF